MTPYYEEDGIRLYCGDCRDILPKIDIDSPVCITDPPYGIGRIYTNDYDDCPDGYWEWFIPCLDMIRKRVPVVCHTHRSIHAVKHLKDWDWIAVWHKPYSAGARIGNSPVLPHWEPIFLYGIYTMGCLGEAFPDVISVNPERSPTKRKSDSPRDKLKAAPTNGQHPLPKPLELMKLLIGRLSTDKNTILDPFCGSGTTLVAAKQLGRKAVGIEISEKYCEIAVKRLAQKELKFL